MEPTVRQPDALSIVDQHLHPVCATVGEQIGVVGLLLAKYLNHPRQDRLAASAHVQRRAR